MEPECSDRCSAVNKPKEHETILYQRHKDLIDMDYNNENRLIK